MDKVSHSPLPFEERWSQSVTAAAVRQYLGMVLAALGKESHRLLGATPAQILAALTARHGRAEVVAAGDEVVHAITDCALPQLMLRAPGAFSVCLKWV